MHRYDETVSWLRDLGAEKVEHIGMTLMEHLELTASRLRVWDAREAVCLAGLAHAVYATDGFATALLAVSDRDAVRAVIGEEAEAITWTYAMADRPFVYAQLPGPDVVHRDRRSGAERTLSAEELTDFSELTFANELEVARAIEFRPDPAVWSRFFDDFLPLVSAPAVAEYATVEYP